MPTTTLPVFTTSNQAQPPGCICKTLAYVSPLASVAQDILDLRQVLATGQIDNIQTLFIDNSLNTASISIQVQGTNQKLTIPAASQAWLPILVSKGNEVFTITSSGGSNVPLFFCNTAMPAMVWAV